MELKQLQNILIFDFIRRYHNRSLAVDSTERIGVMYGMSVAAAFIKLLGVSELLMLWG
jgi:hypothetical protein